MIRMIFKFLFRLILIAAIAYGLWYLLTSYDMLGWFSEIRSAVKTNNTRGLFVLPKRFTEIAKEAKVYISSCQFSPATLTINKNEKVVWVNNDSIDRQIISDSFDSGLIAPGKTYSRVFKDIGTFNYSCADASQNKGQIFVK